MNWLLPEHIADALPRQAAQIERLRRRLLDVFRTHGYELVMPPLLEYLDSLLTGAGQDLDLRTFKLVDQLSGRTMGVRADMTPQVTRIDAHLLNRRGVARLCYCDSVLHTLPASVNASREPIQLGAEIYGHAGSEADIEIVRLMAKSLALAGLPEVRLDFGHVGIFRALAQAAAVPAGLEEELFFCLQGKDVPRLRQLCAPLAEPARQGLLALPELHGGVGTLAVARDRLPALPAVGVALDVLQGVIEANGDPRVGVDLADLRGYHYHNGVVFAAYCGGFAGPIALGGRYDGVGAAFGRARPATGFSVDLREVARLAPHVVEAAAIVAPADPDPALLDAIESLRAEGEVVIALLPGESLLPETHCDRRLAFEGGEWVVESIN